ncbi:MAG: hypothetical protein HYU31_05870 [Deltaproteobacteria bacterium]|nr:hypothetical protein [Deltaproteobacteria bacterium]
MKAAAKKYNTTYKKKIDIHRDTFLPRRSPKEIIQCSGCGAFYHRRHWTLVSPAGFNPPVHVHPIYCPACKKIKERCPSGEVDLLGVGAGDRGEVLRILRNEERRAREKNPLERIMRLAGAEGGWKVRSWRSGSVARFARRGEARSRTGGRTITNS